MISNLITPTPSQPVRQLAGIRTPAAWQTGFWLLFASSPHATRQTGELTGFNNLTQVECAQFASHFSSPKHPGKQPSVRRLVTSPQTSQSCRDLMVTSAPPQLTRNDSRPSICRHHYPALVACPCDRKSGSILTSGQRTERVGGLVYRRKG
jgi:hypothetical protein